MYEENRNRIEQLRVLMTAATVDACVVFQPENIFYYTGFRCAVDNIERMMALVLPLRGMPVLVLPPLEVTLGLAESCVEQVIPWDEKAPMATVIGTLRKSTPHLKRLGVEHRYATLSRVNPLVEALAGITLVDCSPLITQQRVVKSATEIGLLRESARVAAIGMVAAVKAVQPGVTELAVAGAAIEAMLRAGSEGIAFIPTVQAGERALLPNILSSTRPLREGELVVIDLGAKYQGMCSDICWTVTVGGQPSEEQARMMQIIHVAKDTAIRRIRPGCQASDIDRTAREVIHNEGYGEYIMHNVGHGVGYGVHEAPSLARFSAETLASGMTVTVEPGIYKPGVGGVRFEHDIIVTDSGYEIVSPIEAMLRSAGF